MSSSFAFDFGSNTISSGFRVIRYRRPSIHRQPDRVATALKRLVSVGLRRGRAGWHFVQAVAWITEHSRVVSRAASPATSARCRCRRSRPRLCAVVQRAEPTVGSAPSSLPPCRAAVSRRQWRPSRAAALRAGSVSWLELRRTKSATATSCRPAHVRSDTPCGPRGNICTRCWRAASRDRQVLHVHAFEVGRGQVVIAAGIEDFEIGVLLHHARSGMTFVVCPVKGRGHPAGCLMGHVPGGNTVVPRLPRQGRAGNSRSRPRHRPRPRGRDRRIGTCSGRQGGARSGGCRRRPVVSHPALTCPPLTLRLDSAG